MSNYVYGVNWEHLIGEFYQVSLVFENYRLIAALLVFMYFTRVFQFFLFTKPLSSIVDILNSAKTDIFFFVFMFGFILFGFSLMGYLLLGHVYARYKTISSSIINSYLILYGNFSLGAVTMADSNLGMFYISTFIVICYLILSNVLTAILCAYYRLADRNIYSDSPSFSFQV